MISNPHNVATFIEAADIAGTLEENQQGVSQQVTAAVIRDEFQKALPALKASVETISPVVKSSSLTEQQHQNSNEALLAAIQSVKTDIAQTQQQVRAQSDNQPRVRCYDCGKMGHIARNCRSLPRNRGILPIPQRQAQDQQYARPAITQEVWSENPRSITCSACGKRGHVYATCHLVARYLCENMGSFSSEQVIEARNAVARQTGNMQIVDPKQHQTPSGSQ